MISPVFANQKVIIEININKNGWFDKTGAPLHIIHVPESALVKIIFRNDESGWDFYHDPEGHKHDISIISPSGNWIKVGEELTFWNRTATTEFPTEKGIYQIVCTLDCVSMDILNAVKPLQIHVE